MKTNSIKCLALAILVFTGLAGYAKEWIPPYSINKNELSPDLKKNEALVLFVFGTNDGSRVNKDVRMSYNGTNKTLKPTDKLTLTPGKYVFKFYYNKTYTEITTDTILIKPQYRMELSVIFQNSQVPVMAEKPVIYIYPAKTTSVSVALTVKGTLGFTYPAYNNGWKFEADPDGTIHQGKNKYHYLFWDGEVKMNYEKLNLNEGFIVSKSELVGFFEKQLSAMGLNSKETEDFITYWCPKMSANKFNFVHFVFNEEYEKYAGLTVEPKPNSVFRVFMLWNSCTEMEKKEIAEHKTESFIRKEFTVVEWGGAEMLNRTITREIKP